MNAVSPDRLDFWDHLVELRERMLKSLAAIFAGVLVSLAGLEERVFRLALAPLGSKKLMYLDLGEAFTTHLYFSLYLGLIVALPVVAYQIWAFVAPGLYENERRRAVALSFCSCLLFFAGMLFAYLVLLPLIIRFFLSFESSELIYGGALGSYLKLVAGILVGAGLAFQLPLVLLGLIKAGVCSRETLAHQRPYWILGIVVVAAVLTPTSDVLTQMMLALPMWLLYELALIAAWLGGRRKKRSADGL